MYSKPAAILILKCLFVLAALVFPLKLSALPDKPGDKETESGSKPSFQLLLDSLAALPVISNEFQMYLDEAHGLAKEKGQLNQLFLAIDSMGVEARNASNYPRALLMHQKGFELAEALQQAKYMARCYNNFGVIYRRMDEYRKAIDYHYKALKISQKLNDSHGIAVALNSIGNIDFLMGRYESALDNFNKALSREEAHGTAVGVAINLNNIGNVYRALHEYSTAIDYFKRSLEINKNENELKGIAICNDDIGSVYLEKGQHVEALKYFLKALDINETINEKRNIAKSYLHIGEVFYQLNEPQRSLHYLEKALDIAREIRVKSLISKGYNLYSQIEVSQGNFEKALEYYKISKVYEDSMLNAQNQQFAARLRAELESSKQQNLIRILQNETKIAKLELGRRKIINQVAIAGAVLFFILAGVILWFNYHNLRKNKLLREKNEQIYRAQQKLKRNAERMMEAKEQAEQANQTKSLFLANISHEIRTPLNSVIGFTELLSQHIEDQKQRSYLESIKSSGRSLLALINDILDLSKIEAGKIDIEYGPVNIRSLFDELRKIFSLKISQKNLDFRIHVDEKIPTHLVLSESRLRQVLFNLIGNALKYTEEGYVELRAEFERKVSDTRYDICIRVIDTGIGIPRESRKKIFEAFSQSEQELYTKTEGSGLGLSISRRLVEIMNGRIELESQLNEGSIFSIYLLGVSLVEDRFEIVAQDEFDHNNIDFEDACILIADDLEINRELIKDIFSDSRLKVLEAENGRAAIQKTLKYKPDLILMDIRMPVLNGFEALDEIRRTEGIKQIPVIAITAYSFLEELEKSHHEKFEGVLIKPVQISRLYRELIKFLPFRIKQYKNEDHTGPFEAQIESVDLSDIPAAVLKDLKKEWNEVNRTHFINDIIEFGVKVREKGKQVNSEFLKKYADQLIRQAESFNIEKMNETLKEFKNVLSQKEAET